MDKQAFEYDAWDLHLIEQMRWEGACQNEVELDTAEDLGDLTPAAPEKLVLKTKEP